MPVMLQTDISADRRVTNPGKITKVNWVNTEVRGCATSLALGDQALPIVNTKCNNLAKKVIFEVVESLSSSLFCSASRTALISSSLLQIRGRISSWIWPSILGGVLLPRSGSSVRMSNRRISPALVMTLVGPVSLNTGAPRPRILTTCFIPSLRNW